MIYRIFKSGRYIQLIFIIASALALWAAAFIHPVAMPAGWFGIPLYQLLYSLIVPYPHLYTFVAFVLLIAQAFFLNYILVTFNIFARGNYTGAFFYILFMSSDPHLLTLHPALVSNIFIAPVIYYLLKSFLKEDAYGEFFSAGLACGLASLFYFKSIVFVTCIWACLIVFRVYSWREWVISITGLLMVYLYLFSAYFLIDSLLVALSQYKNLFYTVFHKISLPLMNTYQYIFMAAFMLLLLMSFYSYLSVLKEKLISIRKMMVVFAWMLVLVFLAAFFSANLFPDDYIIILLPASLIVSQYYYNSKRILPGEIIFLIYLTSIILLRTV